MIWDILFYLSTMCFSSYMMFGYNLLIKMMTTDSLFTAMHFFKIYFKNNLTDSQIMEEIRKLYTSSSIDRYIYYMLCYITYNIIMYFFWLKEYYMFPLYYLFVLSTLPPLLNKILDSYFFEKIRKKKEDIIKIIIAKSMVSMIKFFSRMYLNKDIKLKTIELMPLLQDYKDTLDYMISGLKNILLILLFSYLKTSYPKMYYGVIKYIYNYKSGDMMESFTTYGAKSLLIDIIDNKKWNEFKKPSTFKAMIHVYQTTINDSDFFKMLLMEFNMSLIKMFTMWTISSFINNIYIIPLLSLFLILYNYIQKNQRELIKDTMVVIIGCILMYFVNSYPLISFVFQFGKNLLFNRVTYITIKTLEKKLVKALKYIFIINFSITWKLFGTILNLCCYNLLDVDNNYIAITLLIVSNVIMNITINNYIMFFVLSTTTCLSSFNMFHVIFNSIIVYILNAYITKDNVISGMTIINNKYAIIKSYSYNKITKTYDFIKYDVLRIKYRYNERIFELMDNKEYPSVSEYMTGRKINIKKIEDDTYNKKNDVAFDNNSMSSKATSISSNIDNALFNLPDDGFINAISIDDSSMYINGKKIIIKRNDDYDFNDLFK